MQVDHPFFGSFHKFICDPVVQEPEDVGPTRLVGYFFLAWLILSFALSVTLNR